MAARIGKGRDLEPCSVVQAECEEVAMVASTPPPKKRTRLQNRSSKGSSSLGLEPPTARTLALEAKKACLQQVFVLFKSMAHL